MLAPDCCEPWLWVWVAPWFCLEAFESGFCAPWFIEGDWLCCDLLSEGAWPVVSFLEDGWPLSVIPLFSPVPWPVVAFSPDLAELRSLAFDSSFCELFAFI